MPKSDFYVDLPDTEPSSGGSDFIPAGEYTMRVTKMENYVAPDKGTPGFRTTFEVIGSQYDGSTIQHTYWLTPAAMGILQGLLKSCGVSYKGNGVNAKNAVGKTVIVKIKIRTGDKGGEFSEVHYTKPVQNNASSEPAPRDEDAPPDKGGKW